MYKGCLRNENRIKKQDPNPLKIWTVSATLENTLAFELDEGSDGPDGRLLEATNVPLDGLVHQGDLGSEHGQMLLTRPLQLFNLLPLQRLTIFYNRSFKALTFLPLIISAVSHNFSL
jgi:hypothetical protein